MLKVSLVRQTLVDPQIQHLRIWRNTTLGVGEIREVPPNASSAQEFASTSADDAHLDWEGEVQCEEDVKVGGFHVMNVAVSVSGAFSQPDLARHLIIAGCIKDHIILSVVPPAHERNLPPFKTVTMSIPIRLVTDSYVELMDYESPANRYTILTHSPPVR